MDKELQIISISSDSEQESDMGPTEKSKRKSKEEEDKNVIKKARLNSESNGSKILAKNGATETTIPGKGRAYTVSIAVAGSIIEKAHTLEAKVRLCYRLAMAANMYGVEEIILYDDNSGQGTINYEQIARLLQFFECPQYLRETVYSKLLPPALKMADFLYPLATLPFKHNLKANQVLPYREGVVTRKSMKAGGKQYALINVGLEINCRVPNTIVEKEGDRVTVQFDDPSLLLKQTDKLTGNVVPKDFPLREAGLYWGYSVRIASSLSKVFSKCPFREGYDVKVGTSEKGSESHLLQPQSYNNLLIVFGGVQGLEHAVETDDSLIEKDITKVFDHCVNICPSQGTTEPQEMIPVGLNAMSQFIPKYTLHCV